MRLSGRNFAVIVVTYSNSLCCFLTTAENSGINFEKKKIDAKSESVKKSCTNQKRRISKKFPPIPQDVKREWIIDRVALPRTMAIVVVKRRRNYNIELFQL